MPKRPPSPTKKQCPPSPAYIKKTLKYAPPTPLKIKENKKKERLLNLPFLKGQPLSHKTPTLSPLKKKYPLSKKKA